MKTLRAGLILVTLLLLAPLPAMAHVLKTDGSIGAILHIDPADDPVAGESASLIFAFKDKQGNFSTQSCNCILVVSEAGKQIYSQTLVPPAGDATDLVTAFTFPERGLYQVEVAGKPSGTTIFQPFDLKYDVRVARVAGRSGSGGTSWYWLLGGAVVVFVLLSAMAIRQTNSKP